jgi:hypothetical protein
MPLFPSLATLVRSRTTRSATLRRRRQTRQLVLQQLELRCLMSASSPDIYEPNNSFQTAAFLAATSGTTLPSELTIHTASDRDFFRFVTSGTGTSSHYIDVLFTHANGDLDARLLDSSGNELASSAGVTNNERLSLQGRPAGTYYIEVYGFGEATNVYRLAFQTPPAPPDRFEANNTFQTATNLQTISGTSLVSDVSIHTSTDRDFYKFTTTGLGTSAHYVDVLFTHANGDLDVRLLDSAGATLATSAGTSNNERLSLQGLAAGSYFVEVFGYSGARNSYRLSFETPASAPPDRFEANDTRATATVLGTVSGTISVADLSIHTSTDRDFFQFTTTGVGTSAHYVDVLFSHSNGDIDVRLLDSAGATLATSAGTSNNERMSLQGLAAGSYFVEVFGYSGARNSYRLSFETPASAPPDRFEANDTRATATVLGTVSGTISVADLSIHTSTDRDFFQFTTTGVGTSAHYVDVLFSHANGDIDVRLLDSAGATLGTSAGTDNNERLSLQGLAAGSYFVEVFGYSGARNSYRLSFETPASAPPDRFEANDTRASATDLRTVSGALSVADLSIHTSTDRDFYQFTTTGVGTSAHYVDVLFSHANGDIDVRLLDSAGATLATSAGTDNNERLSLQGLAAGSYFVEVFGYSGARNIYRLSFETPASAPPDRFEANDTRASATDLRTVSGALSVADLSIHSSTDRDFFRFTTTGVGTSAHYVDVLFAHANGDIDVRLLDSAGAILSSSTGTSNSERLSLQGLVAGSYFVEVFGYSGARNSYRLSFETPASALPDRFEVNDTRATATDLRTVAGRLNVADLSIHSSTDRDFYQFTTTAVGTSAHYVDVLFAHTNGDIDVRLLDSAGVTLAASAGTSNSERLSLQGRGAGTYMIEVFGYSGARNSYSLVFETPASLPPDRFEPNDTRATATDLRTISGSLNLPDLSISANNRDFFRFELAAAATTTHFVQASFVHANGDLDLRLLDAQGAVLRSSLGTIDNERISLNGLSAGVYFVEVFGASASVANSYRLDFATPTNQQSGADAWTIMVYITADDLERFAFQDINEMERAVSRLPGTVNVSVFWDQSSRRTTYATGGGSQPAWGTAGRAFIASDNNTNLVSTSFEILPETNTGNPQTLVDFVQWSVNSAPAQRYGLILWDHGSGLEGFNYDRSDVGQAADNLTTQELAQALSTLRTNGRNIDLLAFDACLMSMTEVGYATRDFTGTFVASQEIVSGNGHDYTTLFRLLESNPYAVTSQSLATGFVRSFGDQYLGTGRADTQSAINSAAYSSVVTAIASFTAAARGATAAERTAMATARNATPWYTADYLRDLGGFMQRIANNAAISQAIRTAATGVVNAVSQAVISKTADQRSSSGMSIFLPILGSPIPPWYSQYAAFDAATGWTAFLRGSTNALRSIQGDWAGSTNNLAARAFDIGTIAGTGLAFDYLSLESASDIDWFRFSIGEASASSNRVIALPSSGNTAFSIKLYDVSGTTLIREVANGANGLSLSGLAAGQYSLRVSADDAIERYALTFDAPGIGAGLVVPNSTAEKAIQWGVLAPDRLLTGFVQTGSGSGDGWSYFRFDTAPLVERQNFALALTSSAGISLDVEILNEAGNPIQTGSGVGSVSVSLSPTGSGESYGLRVRQTPGRSAGTAAAFSVRIDTVNFNGVAQNPVNRFDVNGDNFVNPLDVLEIINLLNRVGSSLPVSQLTVIPPYVNVDGDASVSPLDVLALINFINSGGGGGEGEGRSDVANGFFTANDGYSTKRDGDRTAWQEIEEVFGSSSRLGEQWTAPSNSRRDTVSHQSAFSSDPADADSDEEEPVSVELDGVDPFFAELGACGYE